MSTWDNPWTAQHQPFSSQINLSHTPYQHALLRMWLRDRLNSEEAWREFPYSGGKSAQWFQVWTHRILLRWVGIRDPWGFPRLSSFRSIFERISQCKLVWMSLRDLQADSFWVRCISFPRRIHARRAKLELGLINLKGFSLWSEVWIELTEFTMYCWFPIPWRWGYLSKLAATTSIASSTKLGMSVFGNASFWCFFAL